MVILCQRVPTSVPLEASHLNLFAEVFSSLTRCAASIFSCTPNHLHARNLCVDTSRRRPEIIGAIRKRISRFDQAIWCIIAPSRVATTAAKAPEIPSSAQTTQKGTLPHTTINLPHLLSPSSRSIHRRNHHSFESENRIGKPGMSLLLSLSS